MYSCSDSQHCCLLVSAVLSCPSLRGLGLGQVSRIDASAGHLTDLVWPKAFNKVLLPSVSSFNIFQHRKQLMVIHIWCLMIYVHIKNDKNYYYFVCMFVWENQTSIEGKISPLYVHWQEALFTIRSCSIDINALWSIGNFIFFFFLCSSQLLRK